MGQVAVGYAVKTIPANPVAKVEVVRNGVQIGALGQRVVKSGIEYGDLRNLRTQQFAHGANSAEIRGIVQGGQVDAILNAPHHFVVDEDGIRKSLAAMNHAMSDGVNIGRALDF